MLFRLFALCSSTVSDFRSCLIFYFLSSRSHSPLYLSLSRSLSPNEVTNTLPDDTIFVVVGHFAKVWYRCAHLKRTKWNRWNAKAHWTRQLADGLCLYPRSLCVCVCFVCPFHWKLVSPRAEMNKKSCEQFFCCFCLCSNDFCACVNGTGNTTLRTMHCLWQRRLCSLGTIIITSMSIIHIEKQATAKKQRKRAHNGMARTRILWHLACEMVFRERRTIISTLFIYI